MFKNQIRLTSSVSAAAIAAAASLLAGSPAWAQAAPASSSSTSPTGGQAAGSDQAPGSQQAVAAEQAQSAAGDQPSNVQAIVVTGSTSKRTLLDTSVAITLVNRQQLEQKAPRSTADVLETIPGFFVEGTAGPVSNNYSVRGLPGGGSEFVRLEEDGMPLLYGALNDDEVLQYDLSYDRVEAIQGGTSGVLTENAAGASVNFISRRLNFDHGGGLAKLQGTTYGDKRADYWYSAPLTHNLAFALSGYFDSTPGVRKSPFHYTTWRMKAQVEKQFDDGGYLEFTYKHWNEHDPYYADQPYSFANGKIGGLPALGTQYDSIIGSGFGRIVVPDSCANNECTRTFSLLEGVHPKGNLYRVDFDKPINDSVSVFARARYTRTTLAFNGVFAGSGTGNAGLASAVDYLTYDPAVSPIYSFLQLGRAAFPTATQFGIKSLTDGSIIPASNVAALNALNGNGLLEQTVLNRQTVTQHDFGSDFGFRWNAQGDHWRNSLTVGGMIFSYKQWNDQSGVSALVNDVRNNSNIYDIVALDNSNNVVGTLSNNGLISYGDWGSGINNTKLNSQSVYFNNEFVYNDKLHLDFGLRYEHEHTTANSGNSSPAPIPSNIGGVVRTNPNAFNGTYSTSGGSEHPVNYTVGVNYVFSPALSAYGRYAHSYQTQGGNPKATGLILYEAGLTYSGYGLLGTVRAFRTEFNNLSAGGGVDPSNPNLNQGFFADSHTNGVDVDAFYRPEGPLHSFAVHAQLTYQKTKFTNVRTGTININGQDISSQVDAFYNGKTPGRTPDLLFTITPQWDLPYGWGNIYARYKRVGRIFADNGDALALPSYGVWTLGAEFNLRRNLTLNVSVDNLTNVRGLTEGNPRQGFTQAVVNGYFYGRGIVGTNAMGSLSFAF